MEPLVFICDLRFIIVRTFHNMFVGFEQNILVYNTFTF